jgi:hypothetical protein
MAIRFSNDISKVDIGVIEFKIVEEWCSGARFPYGNSDKRSSQRKKADKRKKTLTKGSLSAQLAANTCNTDVRHTFRLRIKLWIPSELIARFFCDSSLLLFRYCGSSVPIFQNRNLPEHHCDKKDNKST